MKFNPKKNKEMVINFIANPNTVMRTICIGNQVVETVKTYKLLGVWMFSLNLNVDCIIREF